MLELELSDQIAYGTKERDAKVRYRMLEYPLVKMHVS